MVVDKINEFLGREDRSLEDAMRWVYKTEFANLAGLSFDRQFLVEKEESKELRLSSCGKCPRALAYKFHGFEENGKEIDARSMRTFFLGDITEACLVILAKVAGVPLVGYGVQQVRVRMVVDGKEIFGRPDGLICSDGTGLLEVKSMSDFAYGRFERGEIEESYVYQYNAYMDALNLNWCCFVALNKNSGVIGERIVYRDEKIVAQIKENLRSVLSSTPDALPPIPQWATPDAKGFYDWKCLYCGFWKECHPFAEKVLVGKAYKLKDETNKHLALQDAYRETDQ